MLKKCPCVTFAELLYHGIKSLALYSALVLSQIFHEESSKTEYIWNSASHDLVVSQEGSKRFCSVSLISYFFERANS